jgi:CheY-like chemotaxis protein
MASRPATTALSQNEPPKVLLVDDEATGRRLLRRWIERGFEGKVVEAGNGLEALEALAAEEFDLVVLDLMMPVLDGTETLALIRSDPSHGDVEVVVATQLASEQKVRDIISLGVADYILKPLRHDAVVERLHQIITRAREKRKERLRQRDLPTILIADPDPSFCDFAIAALEGRFRGIAARTAAETVVGILKNKPGLVMLSTALPGLPFELLGKKIRALAETTGAKVCLLTDALSQHIDTGFAGRVARTFVPEAFAAEVAKVVGGAATQAGEEPWLTALEPEIVSAVRQALGMMTGREPVAAAEPAGGDADLFARSHLQARSGEFDLIVDLRCRRPFAVALCNAIMGGEPSDVDSEFLLRGVGEILGVVGGRIKNSCTSRKIEVLLSPPQLLDAAPAEPETFYRWQQHFLWQNDHGFGLSVRGTAGSYRGQGREEPGTAEAASPAGTEPATAQPAAAVASDGVPIAASAPADSAPAASAPHEPTGSAESA